MQTNKALVVFLALCVSSLVFAVEVHAGSNINLAVIPDNWQGYGGIGYYSNLSFDYSVVRTSGKPSIRLAPHTSADRNYARECDGRWYAARPGDHIVAKCWIKIDPLPSGYAYETFAGARIGIDLYNQADGHNYLLWEIVETKYRNPNVISEEAAQYVHWGTPGWVQRTIDFVVPTTYFTWNYMPGNAGTIPPTQTDHVVLWLQVWSSRYGATEPGNAWFADAELYINPDLPSSTGSPPVPNQSLFNDGFETGTTSAYSWNSGSPTIVKEVQHSGSYSCRFSSRYCYLAKAGLARDTLYTTVYARISALPPASDNYVTVLRGENVDGKVIYRLFFYRRAGVLTISLASYTPTWSRIDYSLPYVVNTWYCFRVKYSVNNEVRYWVNGVEAGARTGIGSTSLGQQDHVLVGQVESNYATSVWIDDVTVSNIS